MNDPQVDSSVDTVQMRRPVFVDRSGRRDRRVRVVSWVLATLAGVYAVVVGLSVVLAPGSPVGVLPFGEILLPGGSPQEPAAQAVPAATTSPAPATPTTTARPPTSEVAPRPAPTQRAVLQAPPATRVTVTRTATPTSPPPARHPHAVDRSRSTPAATSTTNVAPPVDPPTPHTSAAPPSAAQQASNGNADAARSSH